MEKLSADSYSRKDTVEIAKELLGKVLCTNFEGQFTSGRIVETEAYNGVEDKASHAFGGRRTKRTEVMYAAGGTAYVYLCYGLHQMFNVVTNAAGIPHAILIRAVEPLEGIPAMLLRTGKQKLDFTLTRGPGNVAKALGIHTTHSGHSLQMEKIWIANDDFVLPEESIVVTPRIGVDYAAEDALLPYRFFIKGNKFVSGNARQNILGH